MQIKTSGYTITAGTEWARALSGFITKKRYSSIFILCDENTFRHCLPPLITACPALSSAEIIETEPGEQSKQLGIATHVWQTLTENEADRRSVMINLGGGVITDLGGFCASVYKRGMPFINLPTSLLAMADASVGGKTGIDFSGLKNMLGTFSQPEAVFINPAFLDTLPQRHYYNGLAEILKIALVSDKKLWVAIRSAKILKDPLKLLIRSVRLKNKIVQKDPYDTGMRRILNFGHSIGHAIELESTEPANEILHGEAVVIGMIIESHISWQKKLISKSILQEVHETLSSIFIAIHFPELRTENILRKVRNDKKTSAGRLYFPLITGIGSCRQEVPVSEKQIQTAIEWYNALKL